MRKKAKLDDEQNEEEPVAKKVPGSRNSTTRTTRYMQYNDEHPEVPRVRRASRYQQMASTDTSVGETTSKRTRAIQSTQSAAKRTRALQTRELKPEQPSATTRQLAAPKKRPTTQKTAKALPTVEHTKVGRERRARLHKQHVEQSFFSQVQHIFMNRTALLVASIVLAFFICMPLLSSFAQGGKSLQIVQVKATGTAATAKSTATVVSELQPKNPKGVVIQPTLNDHPAPPVYAKAAYLLDAQTGATLYARNPFTHLPVMSTTKLMTVILAAEKGNLDQRVTITDAIDRDLKERLSPDSSLMYLKKGQTYTMRDLLHGLMLVSGNDAAIAIAHVVSGGYDQFVAEMNVHAKEWGLRDTHFKNPHGLLDDGHYSTARDLAILGKKSMENQIVREVMQVKEYKIPATKDHPERVLSNGNQFLWWYPGANGGKTGWDAATNFVQVISCERDGRRLIGVVIYTKDWWTDMRNLMNYGFNDYKWLSPRELYADKHYIPFAPEWSYFSRDKRESTVPMGKSGRYYSYTGYSISGLFMSYYDKNDGLKKFGYPLGQPKVTGETTQTQKFERGTILCDLKIQKCVQR